MTEYTGQVVGKTTTSKTHVTIPDTEEQVGVVVLECGDRAIEVSLRELFEMLESAIRAWNRRA